MENLLLERLPRNEREYLLSACVRTAIAAGQVLCQAGKPPAHAYFPVDGFVSLVAVLEGKRRVEVAMVGREGMVGAHLALGVASSPVCAVVQGPGSAWRIPSAGLQDVLARSPELRSALQRYGGIVMDQFAVSAACLRFHRIGQRLARWLLMSQDRVCSDVIHVTHETLAGMLGVRRVGVTTAAGALQRSGCISYRHGELTVLDRAALQAAACPCYAASRRAYAEATLPVSDHRAEQGACAGRDRHRERAP